MATATIPTTITPAAAALARAYGVERELEAILEQGRQAVRGLQVLEVDAEPPCDMGDPLIVIRAGIDPAFEDDPTHFAWWSWRFDHFPVTVGGRFLVTTVGCDER